MIRQRCVEPMGRFDLQGHFLPRDASKQVASAEGKHFYQASHVYVPCMQLRDGYFMSEQAGSSNSKNFETLEGVGVGALW